MTSTTAWQKAGILGAGIAAIALFAGCGVVEDRPAAERSDVPLSERAQPSPLDIVREAPDATKAAGTSRYEHEQQMEIKLIGPGGHATDGRTLVTVTTTNGAYDYVRHIGDGRSSGHSEQGAPSGGPMSMSAEVVFTADSQYARRDGEGRWGEFTYERSYVEQPAQQHPARPLDLLHGATDAREAGTKQVRGAETRQYAITIDPTRLDGATTRGNSATAAPTMVAGPLHGHVCLDSDGRVRQLEVSIELTGPAYGSGASFDIRIDYFDFGIPVTAQVPEPSTVGAN
jgi:hypothetical protein